MTSGLQRGSNLLANIPKTMVIPEERERDHERKMRSPLFSEHFVNDNWNLLFFDAFRQTFAKHRTKTTLEDLFGKKKERAFQLRAKEVNGEQSLLEFGRELVEHDAVVAVAEEPPVL
jgi:hypothetical protein